MKLTAIFLLLAIIRVNFSVYGQVPLRPISLSLKNVPLKTVLDSLEKITGYTHFGDADWTKVARNVTVVVEHADLREVLDISFRNQPLVYELVGRTISIRLKEERDNPVGGRLVNGRGEAVAGATIQIKGSKTFVQSNDNGEFAIPVGGMEAILVVESINYETQELRLMAGKDTVVKLKERVIALNGVSVMHTGYQNIPRERATGSFASIDYNLVNRNTSDNILDRLNGVASSLIFNKNTVFGTNQSGFSIRGRSTIFANPEPLIVVDNFPYTGDIRNINPDDVESITLLKDAAAASIWGAFSGNGVVVITTRKGKFNEAPRFNFNTSVTVGLKPDLYYNPILAPRELVDVQQAYYQNQLMNNQLAPDPGSPALPPVAEILIAQGSGQLTPAQANSQLDLLRTQDYRQDLDRYFYRSSLNRQYSLSVNGGGVSNQYYFSGGYDNDLSNQARNKFTRVTLSGNSVYILVPKRLELSTGFNYAATTTTNNNSGSSSSNYSYEKLADRDGNALAIPYLYRQPFIDTVGGGQLLDWNYRPLDELRNADNTTRLSDNRINLGLKYTIRKDLNVNAYYQYWKAGSVQQNYQSQLTYYTRDLINSFTQLGSGPPILPIPLGGILDETDSSYQANTIRLQLNFDHYFNPDQSFTAIAGAELRDIEGSILTTRLYGYDKDLSGGKAVDYVSAFPKFLGGGVSQIPFLDHSQTTSDRFLSYYFNSSYHLLQRYILSASVRKDESNIFGVKANQQGVPLWSAGAAWEISRESFYHADRWLPFLKFRLTDGYNGNVDRSLSAFTTAVANPPGPPYYATTASIVNPPNPSLQWEKIHIVNAGLDFATKESRVEGSLEYYIKYGQGLIGPTTLDPTTGNTELTGNAAAMTTRGVDLTIRYAKEFGSVRWNAVFLFSYSKEKVTNYQQKQSAIADYLNSGFFNPLEGHPLYSIYALKWAGLTHQTGDPQGVLNDTASTDYADILGSGDFRNLVYAGSATPTFFGSFRNSFTWKQFEFSFNILFKFGYYFRRPSINYYDLFSGSSSGHPDFDKRWMRPGDEKFTNVPSLSYSNDPNRDPFYTYSQLLIEKGDHIRLQDIRLGYALRNPPFAKQFMQSAQVYLYANNIGILWKANHQGIDPDAVPGITNYPDPRSLTMGIKLGF